MTKRVVTTYADQKKIDALLKEHLHKNLTNGFWEYGKGWSDERVASAVAKDTGKAINRYHVQTLRQTEYGHIQKGGLDNFNKLRAAASNAELVARVERLESRLDDLIYRLGGEDKPKLANGNGQFRFPLTAAE